MCHLQWSDVKCANSKCHNIVEPKGRWERVSCQVVENDENLVFDGCGLREEPKRGPTVQATWHTCEGCRKGSLEHGNTVYDNYGQYANKVREAEKKSDDERRIRDAQYRSATPMPAEQAAPVYGAGTGWSADQGGYGLGAPAIHFDSGMGVSAMPQDLDLGDFGEEPSHSHDQGYNQGGDEAHNQGGGQGPGGWSQK